jgi:SPP1 gp7 family putative phage head morphogenesis protein
MEQLDKWNKEMRRLSVAKFAETDDALYNYYKEALKSLKVEIKQYTDNYDQLSFSKRLEVENRLKTANRIDGILNDLNSWSDAEIRRYIENEIEVGYYGTWYALEGAENVQLDFGILPERYIETLVNEKVNGQTFSKLLYKKRDELAERVTSALLTSAINGKGYAYAAKEVGELTEASYKQALRIARTEGGRAQSTAKQKAYKEATEKGVQLEKRWLSTLDKKTRHSHQELDGQTVAVDGQFNFNGHKADGPRLFKRASLDINCRCTTVAVVNGIAPDVRKDNLTGEQIEYTNYKDWYASKKTQQTMGKKKYADYVDGLGKKYKTKDFSELLDRMTEKEYEKLSIIDVTDDIVEDIKPKQLSYSDFMKEYKPEFDKSKKSVKEWFESNGTKFADSKKYPIDEGLMYEMARFTDSFNSYYSDFKNANPVNFPSIAIKAQSGMKGGSMGLYRYSVSTPEVLELNLAAGYHGEKTLAWAKRNIENMVESGWLSNNKDISHLYIHEYGHHISNSMRWVSDDVNWQKGFIQSVVEEFRGKAFGSDAEMVSYYATLKGELSAYGVSNESEMFAEMFAEYFGENPRPLSEIFGRKLDEALKGVGNK